MCVKPRLCVVQYALINRVQFLWGSSKGTLTEHTDIEEFCFFKLKHKKESIWFLEQIEA